MRHAPLIQESSPTDETPTTRQELATVRGLYRFVTSETTELKVSCRDLRHLDSFELPIIERLVQCGLMDDGDAVRLRVGVQEALINGIEHGCLELRSEWKEEFEENGSDRFSEIRSQRLLDPIYSGRTVTVRSCFEGERLEISVHDEGKGFLVGQRGASTPKECSVSCSGRGLALMANGADEVKFSNNGAEVILIKMIRRNGSNF